VTNCCFVIVTTNYKTDGIYLPADDRRHYVAWSDLTKEQFTPDYWNGIWSWYNTGGDQHVAAYLKTLELTGFDPKAPPPKTDAWWQIVSAGAAPEDGEIADLLEKLGNPYAIGLQSLISGAGEGEFGEFLRDRKNRRIIPHRLEKAGCVPVRNPHAKDGLWVINGVRQAVYGRSKLSPAERLRAAEHLDAAWKRAASSSV
jgi:hypothetical protein